MITFPAPPPGGYRVIVVDPPWDYGQKGFITWGSPAQPIGAVVPAPYPYMPLDESKALPVAELAAADSRCFLWTTQRYLRVSFEILEGWGFS